MVGLRLIREAANAGLVLVPDGKRLHIRGPRSADGIARRLLAHKPEVLAALQAGPQLESYPTESALDGFDWNRSPGFCPGQPIIRNGIEHKRPDCPGQRGWRHVWGGRYCCDCWPCTDPAALTDETGAA
jgi:hypothetical protein